MGESFSNLRLDHNRLLSLGKGLILVSLVLSVETVLSLAVHTEVQKALLVISVVRRSSFFLLNYLLIVLMELLPQISCILLISGVGFNIHFLFGLRRIFIMLD